jgi:gamma-glutamylcyclotransferase (GGCT)/AIG2-like uncharacterized protein YtfP
LGDYPGAVPSTERLLGEIFQLEETLLAALDEYEGSEFERALVRADLASGRALDCWIYWYVGPARGRLIASGDWLAERPNSESTSDTTYPAASE